jgi:hypothetical protein
VIHCVQGAVLYLSLHLSKMETRDSKTAALTYPTGVFCSQTMWFKSILADI